MRWVKITLRAVIIQLLAEQGVKQQEIMQLHMDTNVLQKAIQWQSEVRAKQLTTATLLALA